MASPDLELLSVRKTFDEGPPVVADFNLTVESGEFVAFLGPSGCGKTTTLRMIAGFESVSEGSIKIKGRDITDLPAERRPTSMIFQNYALFPHLNVRRNISYGLEVKGLPKAERDAKVERIMDKLDLSEVAEKNADRLSGGQRQRIALARGLVVEPDILLLDEPLGALDAHLRKIIQNELKILQRELGVTFVFVTHAQSEALALSDRIVVMNQGRIEQISPPHELYTRPKTPFVANFIGNNTIIEGQLAGRDGGLAVIDTPFGALLGTAPEDLGKGAKAQIAIPAEAIEVQSLETAPSGRVGERLSGRLARSETIGHVIYLYIDLPNGQDITVENDITMHDTRSFRQGSDLALTFAPEQATVIAT